jgi:hypothetical protein
MYEKSVVTNMEKMRSIKFISDDCRIHLLFRHNDTNRPVGLHIYKIRNLALGVPPVNPSSTVFSFTMLQIRSLSTDQFASDFP